MMAIVDALAVKTASGREGRRGGTTPRRDRNRAVRMASVREGCRNAATTDTASTEYTHDSYNPNPNRGEQCIE